MIFLIFLDLSRIILYVVDKSKKGDFKMPKNTKQTSARAASAASKVLRDGRTSKASKTAAGSALSQTPSKKGR
jgi:hypothetical protein